MSPKIARILSGLIAAYILTTACSIPLVRKWLGGEIVVQVIDRDGNTTKEPAIRLENSDYEIIEDAPEIMENGQFKFSNLRWGDYTIFVTAEGYSYSVRSVRLKRNATFNVKVILHPRLIADSSQNGFGKITGTITYAANGIGIPGVSLWLEDTKLGVAANFEGSFTIDSIPPGIYLLNVKAIGYSTIILKGLTIYPDETLELDITMLSRAVVMSHDFWHHDPPFIDRYQTSNKTEVDDEDIEAMPVSTVHDILKKTPGFVK